MTHGGGFFFSFSSNVFICFGDGFCKRFNTILPEASATRTIGTFRRASVQRELNVIHGYTPGMVLVGGFWQMMRLKNKMVKCIKIKSLLNTAKIKFTSDVRTLPCSALFIFARRSKDELLRLLLQWYKTDNRTCLQRGPIHPAVGWTTSSRGHIIETIFPKLR